MFEYRLTSLSQSTLASAVANDVSILLSATAGVVLWLILLMRVRTGKPIREMCNDRVKGLLTHMQGKQTLQTQNKMRLKAAAFTVILSRYTIATFLSSFFTVRAMEWGISDTYNGLIFAGYPLGMSVMAVFAPQLIEWYTSLGQPLPLLHSGVPPPSQWCTPSPGTARSAAPSHGGSASPP